SISWMIQANALPELRQESAQFASMHSDVLQDALRRLNKAYQSFFRRVKAGDEPGFPRFKGEGRYRSMTFSHLSKQLIRTIRKRMARIVVPKIGHIAIRYHRPLPDGKIKHLTLHRKASGWYVSIVIEIIDPVEVPVKTTIGVDVGLEPFLTTSDGENVSNPRHFRESENKLGVAQRRLSRRKKGSRRYKKQREHVAKIHEHIAKQRQDFHYKTAHWLFLQGEEVAVENLKIKNMVKNHYLSKSISDAGWGRFRLILQSKAANAGLTLTQVNPKHTSQKCSGCDSIVPKSLSVRTHDCPHCGLVIDRDHNAAINIKKAAVALRGGVVVTNTPETPERDRSAEPCKTCGAAVSNKPCPLGQGN
ncbi:IS200/IS605 family element transposase accessory protein TnpB, partial [Candidatus Poribacteria bacterium]|nr:IS200/IS605 family element transposase accessory protein TnpB [Candidatus Poribacteria bacterium]